MSRVTGIAPTCPTANFHELSLEIGAGTVASQHEQKRNLQGGDALQQVDIYKIPLKGLNYPSHHCPHIPRIQVSDGCPPKAVGIVF